MDSKQMTLDKLYERAWNEGIEVDDVPMREIMAVAFPDQWIAIDGSKYDSTLKYKCDLAHEIAHIEKGSFYNVRSPYCLKSKCEYRANKRAASILMPFDEVIQALRSGYVTSTALAEYFDVTDDFARMTIDIYTDKIREINQLDQLHAS